MDPVLVTPKLNPNVVDVRKYHIGMRLRRVTLMLRTFRMTALKKTSMLAHLRLVASDKIDCQLRYTNLQTISLLIDYREIIHNAFSSFLSPQVVTRLPLNHYST
jgi:hypothetical protein